MQSNQRGGGQAPELCSLLQQLYARLNKFLIEGKRLVNAVFFHQRECTDVGETEMFVFELLVQRPPGIEGIR